VELAPLDELMDLTARGSIASSRHPTDCETKNFIANYHQI
jgi:hypothetical protein